MEEEKEERSAMDVGLKELSQMLQDFAKARDWEKYHTPRNLLLAMVGEVGELSEIFQWKGEVEKGLTDWEESDKEHVGEEISDVLLYLVRLADVCGIDLPQAATKKLLKNAIKYPLPKSNDDASSLLRRAYIYRHRRRIESDSPHSFPISSPAVVEMEGSVFTPSLEGMKHVKSPEGEMLTKPFLEVCKQILPVVEKFGAAMALVKADIGGNISRLENKYESNPSKYEKLYSMVQEEVEAKTAKGSSSCTNGLLWLTRAMDFLAELFRNLLAHPEWTMSQACTESYGKTLKKWHGWLASSSFTVAMKLAPDRKKFMEVISGTGDVNADMEKFCTTFPTFLEENHKFLAGVGLDELKAS